jgi:hypothetical protein
VEELLKRKVGETNTGIEWSDEIGDFNDLCAHFACGSIWV